MSGKAPKTILLNEEDWNEWGKDPDWTPDPEAGYEYTPPTTIPGKAEQNKYNYAAHITMSDIAKFHRGSTL